MRDYRRTVPRRLSAFVVAGVLTVFVVLLLKGHYAGEGPVLLRLGEDRGIHVGDLVVVLGWSVALLAVLVLLRASSRRDG